VKHYEQLLNNIQKTPNAAIDKTTLDVFNGAVSAYLQIPDIDKAAAVSSTLLKLGPDEEKVNLSLIAFAMKLEMERKGLQSKLDATPPPPESEASEMRTKRDSYVKLMEDLLKSLSARENLSTKNKVWIAQKAGLLGFDGITTELAKKLLAIPDLDPKAIPSLRKLLVEILARQNHFEDAIAQVDDLIKQFPRALEPQLTKGEILEKWAKKEPSKYDLAVQHWEKTRRWLQRVPPDKNGLKVPEYYDITYREAKCLFEVAQKTSNKEKALDGLRIVQQVLMFDPKMKDKSKRSYSEFERYTKLSKALQELSGVDVNKTTATEKTSSN
jgi:tetratricopeptide (TPR) repeat protein